MLSARVLRQAFWCSITGDRSSMDPRFGPAAARRRARLGAPQYRTVASAGWLRDGRRGLPVLHPAACRMVGEPRRFCAGCCPARLAAARPLRAASAGPALGNIEPRTVLDDANHHLALWSA